MHGKALNFREADRVLKANGYYCIRKKGDHYIYSNQKQTISIPHGKAFSQKTWKRECKKHNIKGG